MVYLRLKSAASSQTDMLLPFPRLKLMPPQPRLRECPFAGEEELRNARRRGKPSAAIGAAMFSSIRFQLHEPRRRREVTRRRGGWGLVFILLLVGTELNGIDQTELTWGKGDEFLVAEILKHASVLILVIHIEHADDPCIREI